MRDRGPIYDEQINPLMKQIIAICKEHDIPMVATFQLSDGECEEDEDNGCLFCTTAIPSDWQDDRLREMVRAAQRNNHFAAFTITTKEPTP